MSKASKNRACPAVGREIPVSECGAHRHNPYACPATCPHDPFAPTNYFRLLELEDKLDRQWANPKRSMTICHRREKFHVLRLTMVT
jgi:hypothetical protein